MKDTHLHFAYSGIQNYEEIFKIFKSSLNYS